MHFPTIKLRNGVPILPYMYPGEVTQNMMRMNDIRFLKNWTTSSNFREQIEALEISHEWVEKLKCDHDNRMSLLLRNRFCATWVNLGLRLLVDSGTEIRTLRIPVDLDVIEMELRQLNEQYGGTGVFLMY